MVSCYVAFLRGMNLGRRRIRNEDLCACFEAIGFQNASAFLASGNIVFESCEPSTEEIVDRIQSGLKSSLNYEVPTYLRSADELIQVANIAARSFAVERGSSIGKLQVAFLSKAPSVADRRKVLALDTRDDRLAIRGRELLWLPSGGISQSELDFKLIESAIGPMTVRTIRTIERIVKKYFDA